MKLTEQKKNEIVKMSSHQIRHWFRCWERFPLAVQFPFPRIKGTHQSVEK